MHDEHDRVAGKRGATRLDFALLPRFYDRHGRAHGAGAKLPDPVVQLVAEQVRVPASQLGCTTATADRSSATGRRSGRHFGSRECSVEDTGKLTG